MDKEWPKTWTTSYVSSNRTECLERLKEMISILVDHIRHEDYFFSVRALDEIAEGLSIMHNGKCGNFRSHIAMLSLCEASIAAFGLGDPKSNWKDVVKKSGKDVVENIDKYTDDETERKCVPPSIAEWLKSWTPPTQDDCRKMALPALEDARDFSSDEATKNIINSMLAELKANKPLMQIKEKFEPNFPEGTIDILTNLISQLSDVSSFTSTDSNSGNRSNSSSGGCYVATAVYGSYNCQQVWTLRRYRDAVLASTWYGRAFIHTYYAISPILVKWFGHTAWFQKLWRSRLDRMVKKLNNMGIENTPYEDKKW